jgi:hypothetical protein
MIRGEAKSLGMSTDEYVRLTGTLFSTLRKAMSKQQTIDGRGLLQLVENPLFAAVIQYMASQTSKKEPDTSAPEQVEALNPAQPHPVPGLPTAPGVPQMPSVPPHVSIPPEWQYW